MAHFEIFPSKDGHRWRLVADNGEVVAQSEGYEGGPSAAERGAADATRAALDARTTYGGTEGVQGFSIDARVVEE